MITFYKTSKFYPCLNWMHLQTTYLTLLVAGIFLLLPHCFLPSKKEIIISTKSNLLFCKKLSTWSRPKLWKWVKTLNLFYMHMSRLSQIWWVGHSDAAGFSMTPLFLWITRVLTPNFFHVTLKVYSLPSSIHMKGVIVTPKRWWKTLVQWLRTASLINSFIKWQILTLYQMAKS